MATEEELCEVDPSLTGISTDSILTELKKFGSFETLDINGDIFFVIDQSAALDRKFKCLNSFQGMMNRGLDARTPITAFLLSTNKRAHLGDYMKFSGILDIEIAVEAVGREADLLDLETGFPERLVEALLSLPRMPFWTRPKKLLKNIPGVRSVNEDWAGCLLAARGHYVILADKWMFDPTEEGLPLMIRGRGTGHPTIFHDPELSPPDESALPPEPAVLQLEGPGFRRDPHASIPRWKARMERWKRRKPPLRGSARRRDRGRGRPS
ncbi:hypothetical protein [Roseibium sp. RKSG952]|uniref:hypothetical protein n=1 Tax=Roseibium sp. RKSG952 TaxID=2529384 RepID=UPI0012BD5C49|nr:hypothetical protein [Roseibium sp. RKSG952]MTH95453.1 hypothetical protein [Roseibium sp. RKSG952]